MTEQVKETSKSGKFKKIIIGTSIILASTAGIYSYYMYNKVFPNTDNAYVHADIVNVSARVSGYIDNVYVTNNQYVHKGDKLIEIDQKDYKLDVEQAKANLAIANGKVQVAKEQIAIAKSNFVKAESEYSLAEKMAKRYNNLYNENAGSKQDAQKYSDNEVQAKSALNQAKSSVSQATVNLNMANAEVDVAKAQLDSAKLNLSYTILTAPSNGFVSNMNVYKGELINKGSSLFGFISDKNWWVNANFKETDINRIKKGQPVTIELDMYDHKYKGIVNSISYASGTTFSLLPSENATGNWVKVTQRFPVKITVRNNLDFPLRVGASATVKVDTISI